MPRKPRKPNLYSTTTTISKSPQFDPNDPQTRKRLADAAQQIMFAEDQIQSEKEAIKDIIDELHEEIGVDKSLLKQAIRLYTRNEFVYHEAKHEAITEIYDIISTPRSRSSYIKNSSEPQKEEEEEEEKRGTYEMPENYLDDEESRGAYVQDILNNFER